MAVILPNLLHILTLNVWTDFQKRLWGGKTHHSNLQAHALFKKKAYN
jgi:hypothetical protein